MNSKHLIRQLQLQPHPEGGFYKETYRSNQSVVIGEGKNRNISTAIFYLLENKDRSAFHRIQSDELWFFHQGQPLEIASIRDGGLFLLVLGNDLEQGETPQAIIPADTWFAAKIKSGFGYSLVSCTVAPGFDFADFELAKRENLIHKYPHLRSTIEQYYTREPEK